MFSAGFWDPFAALGSGFTRCVAAGAAGGAGRTGAAAQGATDGTDAAGGTATENGHRASPGTACRGSPEQ